VGEVTVTRIVENEDASMTASAVLPAARPEALAAMTWLRPGFVDEAGRLIMSVHALLIESRGQRICVDTCLGNDKPRIVPLWNRRQGPFLDDIAAAGFARERMDYVICTHLHPDHVGWNTMRVDNRWVPTFPNARYVISAADWQWLDSAPVTALGDYCGDSVRPVVDAGLADLVQPGYAVTDEVSLLSTPGHSPGHVSVLIRSRGEQAVITGDLMHHPCQLGEPDWASPFDFDKELARRTRKDFIRRYADGPTLVFGTHFATPGAGRIVADGKAWRFEPDAGV
jgi:glyoxylase-like metal-dependent hydrolase (beta-lactamase superfamily II)